MNTRFNKRKVRFFEMIAKNADVISGWNDAISGLLDIIDPIAHYFGIDCDLINALISLLVKSLLSFSRLYYVKNKV